MEKIEEQRRKDKAERTLLRRRGQGQRLDGVDSATCAQKEHEVTLDSSSSAQVSEVGKGQDQEEITGLLI